MSIKRGTKVKIIDITSDHFNKIGIVKDITPSVMGPLHKVDIIEEGVDYTTGGWYILFQLKVVKRHNGSYL